MEFVIGRETGDGPTGRLGRYRALDGSDGAPLFLDLDGPHAVLVVGKRGYGKSYTLGVLAEELGRTAALAPVVVDPMGVFDTLAAGDVPVTVVEEPAVTPDSLDPRSWCELLALSPERAAGALVWQAAQSAPTLAGMRTHVERAEAPRADRRAASNHLALADAWGVFDADGLDAHQLGGDSVTVLDVSGLERAPANAVVRGVCEALYRARIDGTIRRLPWLLIDEAHGFFGGVAEVALHRLLTRGRTPGVSLVLATQRPSALSQVGISQADLLIAHRLTASDDVEALRDARPTYLERGIDDRMPTEPGEVVIVDDSTETVHAARIRERATPHGGDSPSAREVFVPGKTGGARSGSGRSPPSAPPH